MLRNPTQNTCVPLPFAWVGSVVQLQVLEGIEKNLRAHRCCKMTPVGFEPTQLALLELESTPLDHSGKVSLPVIGSFSANKKQRVCVFWSCGWGCAGLPFACVSREMAFQRSVFLEETLPIWVDGGPPGQPGWPGCSPRPVTHEFRVHGESVPRDCRVGAQKNRVTFIYIYT